MFPCNYTRMQSRAGLGAPFVTQSSWLHSATASLAWCYSKNISNMYTNSRFYSKSSRLALTGRFVLPSSSTRNLMPVSSEFDNWSMTTPPRRIKHDFNESTPAIVRKQPLARLIEDYY